jgi:hypothetical protein
LAKEAREIVLQAKSRMIAANSHFHNQIVLERQTHGGTGNTVPNVTKWER